MSLFEPTSANAQWAPIEVVPIDKFDMCSYTLCSV